MTVVVYAHIFSFPFFAFLLSQHILNRLRVVVPKQPPSVKPFSLTQSVQQFDNSQLNFDYPKWSKGRSGKQRRSQVPTLAGLAPAVWSQGGTKASCLVASLQDIVDMVKRDRYNVGVPEPPVPSTPIRTQATRDPPTSLLQRHYAVALGDACEASFNLDEVSHQRLQVELRHHQRSSSQLNTDKRTLEKLSQESGLNALISIARTPSGSIRSPRTKTASTSQQDNILSGSQSSTFQNLLEVGRELSSDTVMSAWTPEVSSLRTLLHLGNRSHFVEGLKSRHPWLTHQFQLSGFPNMPRTETMSVISETDMNAFVDEEKSGALECENPSSEGDQTSDTDSESSGEDDSQLALAVIDSHLFLQSKTPLDCNSTELEDGDKGGQVNSEDQACLEASQKATDIAINVSKPVEEQFAVASNADEGDRTDATDSSESRSSSHSTKSLDSSTSESSCIAEDSDEAGDQDDLSAEEVSQRYDSSIVKFDVAQATFSEDLGEHLLTQVSQRRHRISSSSMSCWLPLKREGNAVFNTQSTLSSSQTQSYQVGSSPVQLVRPLLGTMSTAKLNLPSEVSDSPWISAHMSQNSSFSSMSARQQRSWMSSTLLSQTPSRDEVSANLLRRRAHSIPRQSAHKARFDRIREAESELLEWQEWSSQRSRSEEKKNGMSQTTNSHHQRVLTGPRKKSRLESVRAEETRNSTPKKTHLPSSPTPASILITSESGVTVRRLSRRSIVDTLLLTQYSATPRKTGVYRIKQQQTSGAVVDVSAIKGPTHNTPSTPCVTTPGPVGEFRYGSVKSSRQTDSGAHAVELKFENVSSKASDVVVMTNHLPDQASRMPMTPTSSTTSLSPSSSASTSTLPRRLVDDSSFQRPKPVLAHVQSVASVLRTNVPIAASHLGSRRARAMQAEGVAVEAARMSLRKTMCHSNLSSGHNTTSPLTSFNNKIIHKGVDPLSEAATGQQFSSSSSNPLILPPERQKQPSLPPPSDVGHLPHDLQRRQFRVELVLDERSRGDHTSFYVFCKRRRLSESSPTTVSTESSPIDVSVISNSFTRAVLEIALQDTRYEYKCGWVPAAKISQKPALIEDFRHRQQKAKLLSESILPLDRASRTLTHPASAPPCSQVRFLAAGGSTGVATSPSAPSPDQAPRGQDIQSTDPVLRVSLARASIGSSPAPQQLTCSEPAPSSSIISIAECSASKPVTDDIPSGEPSTLGQVDRCSDQEDTKTNPASDTVSVRLPVAQASSSVSPQCDAGHLVDVESTSRDIVTRAYLWLWPNSGTSTTLSLTTSTAPTAADLLSTLADFSLTTASQSPPFFSKSEDLPSSVFPTCSTSSNSLLASNINNSTSSSTDASDLQNFSLDSCEALWARSGGGAGPLHWPAPARLAVGFGASHGVRFSGPKMDPYFAPAVIPLGIPITPSSAPTTREEDEQEEDEKEEDSNDGINVSGASYKKSAKVSQLVDNGLEGSTSRSGPIALSVFGNAHPSSPPLSPRGRLSPTWKTVKQLTHDEQLVDRAMSLCEAAHRQVVGNSDHRFFSWSTPQATLGEGPIGPMYLKVWPGVWSALVSRSGNECSDGQRISLTGATTIHPNFYPLVARFSHVLTPAQLPLSAERLRWRAPQKRKNNVGRAGITGLSLKSTTAARTDTRSTSNNTPTTIATKKVVASRPLRVVAVASKDAEFQSVLDDSDYASEDEESNSSSSAQLEEQALGREVIKRWKDTQQDVADSGNYSGDDNSDADDDHDATPPPRPSSPKYNEGWATGIPALASLANDRGAAARMSSTGSQSSFGALALPPHAPSERRDPMPIGVTDHSEPLHHGGSSSRDSDSGTGSSVMKPIPSKSNHHSPATAAVNPTATATPIAIETHGSRTEETASTPAAMTGPVLRLGHSSGPVPSKSPPESSTPLVGSEMTQMCVEVVPWCRPRLLPDPMFDPIFAVAYHIRRIKPPSAIAAQSPSPPSVESPSIASRDRAASLVNRFWDLKGVVLCLAPPPIGSLDVADIDIFSYNPFFCDKASPSNSTDSSSSTSSSSGPAASSFSRPSPAGPLNVKKALARLGLLQTGLVVRAVRTERALLAVLISMVRRIDPDALVGYELSRLSWGYLRDRFFAIFPHAPTFEAHISRNYSIRKPSSLGEDVAVMGADGSAALDPLLGVPLLLSRGAGAPVQRSLLEQARDTDPAMHGYLTILRAECGGGPDDDVDIDVESLLSLISADVQGSVAAGNSRFNPLQAPSSRSLATNALGTSMHRPGAKGARGPLSASTANQSSSAAATAAMAMASAGGVGAREGEKLAGWAKYAARKGQELQVKGRLVLNVWRLMRHEEKLSSYTLQSVARKVLNRTLPSFTPHVLVSWSARALSGACPDGVRRCLRHVIAEVTTSQDLLSYVEWVERTVQMARVYGLRLCDVANRGSQIRVESIMLRIARPLQYLCPGLSPRQVSTQPAMEAQPLNLEPEPFSFYTSPVIVLGRFLPPVKFFFVFF